MCVCVCACAGVGVGVGACVCVRFYASKILQYIYITDFYWKINITYYRCHSMDIKRRICIFFLVGYKVSTSCGKELV